jgi:hypothetical protein
MINRAIAQIENISFFIIDSPKNNRPLVYYFLVVFASHQKAHRTAPFRRAL